MGLRHLLGLCVTVATALAIGRVAAAQTLVSEVQGVVGPPAVIVEMSGASTTFGNPAVVTFGVAAAADWVTTVHSLAIHHGHENNPLINWAPSTATTVAFGAAIDVVTLAAWERLTYRHPHLRSVGLYFATGVRSFVASRNEYRIAHPPGCATPPPCPLNCISVFSRCP